MSKEDIVAHQFKPGQTGNPNGRPKGSKSLKTMLMELLSSQDPDGEWSKSVGGQLIRKAFRDGDMRALEQIIDRIEGKVPGTPLVDQSQHKVYAFFDYSKLTEEDIERIHRTNQRISAA